MKRNSSPAGRRRRLLRPNSGQHPQEGPRRNVLAGQQPDREGNAPDQFVVPLADPRAQLLQRCGHINENRPQFGQNPQNRLHVALGGNPAFPAVWKHRNPPDRLEEQRQHIRKKGPVFAEDVERSSPKFGDWIDDEFFHQQEPIPALKDEIHGNRSDRNTRPTQRASARAHQRRPWWPRPRSRKDTR